MRDAGAPRALFPVSTAGSAPLLAGISLAIVVETVAVHLMLRARHPAAAWILTTLSVVSLLWIVLDHRAVGRNPLALGDGELLLRYGRRFSARVPVAQIAEVSEPSWRDTPPAGTPGYVRLSGFADPNVMLRFRAPVRLSGPAGITRAAERVGLRLEAPAAFVQAVRTEVAAGSA